jgi:hypothetical protein
MFCLDSSLLPFVTSVVRKRYNLSMRYNAPIRFTGYVRSLAIFLMAWLPAGAQTAKEIYNFPASDAPNLINSLVAAKGATFYGTTLGVQLVNAGVIFSVEHAGMGSRTVGQRRDAFRAGIVPNVTV